MMVVVVGISSCLYGKHKKDWPIIFTKN